MQGKTFLIAAKDKIKQDKSITTLLVNNYVNAIDITVIQNDGPVSPSERASRGGSIGISEIRLLQKNIFLKPLRGTTKACIIKNAEKLTVEAQNALLKILEEPPDNTLIILAANDTNAFLPTVLSRCTIIRETEEAKSVDVKDENILAVLQTETIGQKLKRAQDLAKNKDEAIEWIENTILSLRQELITGICHSEHSEESPFHTIKSFQKTYFTLKTTNTNPRLTLENLFLNISSSV